MAGDVLQGPDEEGLRALARTHAEDAIKVLAEVMATAETPPAARVSAAVNLIERGYGKSGPSLTPEEAGELVVKVMQFAGNNPSK